MKRTLTSAVVALAMAAVLVVAPTVAQATGTAREHELRTFYRSQVRTLHEVLRVRWSGLVPRLKGEEARVDVCLPTISSDAKAKTIPQSDAELLDLEALIEVDFGSMRPLVMPLVHVASVDARLRMVFSARQRVIATKAARLLTAVEGLQACTDYDAWSAANWASDATPTGVKVTKQIFSEPGNPNPAARDKMLKGLSPSQRRTLRMLSRRAQRHLNHPTKAYNRQFDQWANSQALA